MKQTGQGMQMLGVQGLAVLIGINGVINMLVFGIQKFLATLPAELKFWLFWLGAVGFSLAISYLVFRVIFKHHKENWIVLAGAAGMGIIVMILASPILPAFFPINPAELALSGSALEAGADDSWIIFPAALGLFALALAYLHTRIDTKYGK